MPSLRDLRRKIKSVKSTQQITQAMKMVAAARLRRGQDRILNARPFAIQMDRMLKDLAGRLSNGPSLHPLMEERLPGPSALLLITSDKGLCGAFNANLIHKAAEFLSDRPTGSVQMFLAGRKGRDYFRRHGFPVANEYVGIFNRMGYSHAELIGGDLIEAFLARRLSEVVVIYNEFKSAIQQRLTVERLLPVPRPEAPVFQREADYLYEPDRPQLLEALLPRYVKSQVYRALLESYAAEMGARMAAMENATSNAREMIAHLTLVTNKVRQSGITREILEVVSGAEALR